MNLTMSQSTSDDLIDGKSILVTGGTGSLGQRFIETILHNYKPKRVVIYSRDEMKQFDMARRLSPDVYPSLRYFIGDVRDRERLIRACARVDIIVHAAAMKHIMAAEYNPTECIATNVTGAQNVIDAAIANDVQRVVALSTDKAANPINLYGATKLCSDKLFVAANNLAGKHQTRFAVLRYGNVIGSRGSVIPHFKTLVANGCESLPITDVNMTRFVITLDQGVSYVIKAIRNLYGGEVIVPKLPSVKIIDLVKHISPTGKYEVIGIRPGEKLHEVMIPLEESRNCMDMGDHYIIQPTHYWWNAEKFFEKVRNAGKPVESEFEYDSYTNSQWLSDGEIKNLISAVPAG